MIKELTITNLLLLAAFALSCGDMYSEMAENSQNLNTGAPAVTSVAPVNGEPDTIVSLEITGTGFQAGAAARLTMTGLEIPADGEIVSDGTKISCSVDLAGAALGKWTVVVTNPDGLSGELTDAFEVSLTHSVIYDANGGITPPGDPSTYFSGDTVTVLGQGGMTRAGYDFAGWYDPGSGITYNESDTFTMPVTDVTLAAQWTANDYAVTFNAEGGDAPVPLSTTVTFDSSYGALATTNQNGYTFTGWWTNTGGTGTEITAADIVSMPADHILYAGWNAISYAITYDLDGGSDPVNPASYTIETPTINLLPSTKTGYAFDGWFDGAMMVTEITIGSTGDVSLVAIWTAEDYNLTFHANDGSGSTTTQTFTFNILGGLDPNPFTPAGYSFDGWATTPAGAVAFGDGASYIMTTEGADLYARWTANTYTVTFDWDDGMSTTSTGSVTFGAPYGAMPTPTFAGHTFGGWYTGDNGTGDLVTAATTVSVASDHTLHAKWTIDTYTVSFDSQGGSAVDPQMVIYGGLVTEPTAPTNPGYDVIGWYRESACTNQWTFASDTVTADMTLYAKWARWSRLDGAPGKSTSGMALAVDASNNLYITGHTLGDLNGETLTGLFDAFVIKYDSTGNNLWTRLSGVASTYTAGKKIGVDSSGNCYVTGFTEGPLDGETMTGTQDLFLIKYDSSGNKLWTRLSGALGADSSSGALFVDSVGNCYVAGWSKGNYDGHTMTGTQDFCIIKYATNGTKSWSKLNGVPSANSIARGISVDSGGNIYVSGFTNGPLDGESLNGTQDVFTSKYNSSGTRLWTRLLGVSGQSSDGSGICLDAGGNSYVSGTTNGNLDGQTLNGTFDAFVIKYDTSGAKQWTTLSGVSGATTAGSGICIAGSNIYVTGNTNGNLDGQTLTGTIDAFAFKCDLSGTKLWTRMLGAAGATTYGKEICLDSDLLTHVCGYTNGNLGGHTLVGTQDAFITTRLNP